MNNASESDYLAFFLSANSLLTAPARPANSHHGYTERLTLNCPRWLLRPHARGLVENINRVDIDFLVVISTYVIDFIVNSVHPQW